MMSNQQARIKLKALMIEVDQLKQPKLGTIEYLGTKYAYNISNETKDKIIDTLLAYYAKHGVCGEGLMQDDDAQTYAPDVLAYIADDLIQFTEIGEIE